MKTFFHLTAYLFLSAASCFAETSVDAPQSIRLLIAQPMESETDSLVFILYNPTHALIITSALASRQNSLTLFTPTVTKRGIKLKTHGTNPPILYLSSEVTFWVYPVDMLLNASQPALFYMKWDLWNMDSHYKSQPAYFTHDDQNSEPTLPSGQRIAVARNLDRGGLSFRLIIYNDTAGEMMVKGRSSPGNRLEIISPNGKKIEIPSRSGNSDIVIDPGKSHVEDIDLAELLKLMAEDLSFGPSELTWTVLFSDGETRTATFSLVKINREPPPENATGYRSNLPIGHALAQSDFISSSPADHPYPIANSAIINLIVDAVNTVFRPRVISSVAISGNAITVLFNAAACYDQSMSNKFKLALSRFSVENTAGLTIDNLGEWRKIVRNVAVSITNSKEAYAAWARCWLIFCANEKFVLSDLEVMQMIDQIYEVVHFVPSPEALNAITDKINGINACDWNTETKVFFLATGLELLQLFDKN